MTVEDEGGGDGYGTVRGPLSMKARSVTAVKPLESDGVCPEATKKERLRIIIEDVGPHSSVGQRRSALGRTCMAEERYAKRRKAPVVDRIDWLIA